MKEPHLSNLAAQKTQSCDASSKLMKAVLLIAAYFVQGVKMSLGTLTQSYYLKDNLLFNPPGVGKCMVPNTAYLHCR